MERQVVHTESTFPHQRVSDKMPAAGSDQGREEPTRRAAVSPTPMQVRVCVVRSDRVQSLCYLQLTRQLVSCSSDGGIAVWNMDVSRAEVRVGAGQADQGCPPDPGFLVSHPTSQKCPPRCRRCCVASSAHLSFHGDKQCTQAGHPG